MRVGGSASRSPAPWPRAASPSTSPTSTQARRRGGGRLDRLDRLGLRARRPRRGSLRAVAAAAAERAGALDVWVNNAGVLVTGHVWEHDAELRRTLFEVNALGTINGSLAALELMRPPAAAT